MKKQIYCENCKSFRTYSFIPKRGTVIMQLCPVCHHGVKVWEDTGVFLKDTSDMDFYDDD